MQWIWWGCELCVCKCSNWTMLVGWVLGVCSNQQIPYSWGQLLVLPSLISLSGKQFSFIQSWQYFQVVIKCRSYSVCLEDTHDSILFMCENWSLIFGLVSVVVVIMNNDESDTFSKLFLWWVNLQCLACRLGGLIEYVGVRRDGANLISKLVQPLLQILGDKDSSGIWVCT
jgi:hypothetical protein